jgi:hypothetical protein
LKAVGHNDNILPAEKVENPVLNASMGSPQLVDPVAEVICLGTPDLMSQLLQSSQPCQALVSDLGRLLVKPVEYWDTPVFFLVEENFRPWQLSPPMFAILLMPVNPAPFPPNIPRGRADKAKDEIKERWPPYSTAHG